MNLRSRVATAFNERFFGAPALETRAPGRVNLMGEHTDYNEGFVLPMAIDRDVRVALRPRADGRVVVHSLDFDETAEFDLKDGTHDPRVWVEYLKGVTWALRVSGAELSGWEGVVGGEVPRGAGLSSSAALELAALRAFAAVSGLTWDATRAAVLGHRVDRDWIGVNSGLTKHLAVAGAVADHALLIDCRSNALATVRLPEDVDVVVLDTSTRSGLADAADDERRRQCAAAATALAATALRDVTVRMLEEASDRFDPVTLRRARHVVSENDRTLHTAAALRDGDAAFAGELMNASHASLREDFEVSNDELDTMATIAQNDRACHGARMTGAGGGGCVVALVRRGDAARFIDNVEQSYRTATGLTPRAFACRAVGGASLEPSIESESL